MRPTSIFHRFLFSIKKFFIRRNKPPLSIVWTAPIISQEPSTSFKNSLSEEERGKLDKIFQEVHLISQIYKYVPPRLNEKDWSSLLKCENPKQVLNQLRFFYEVWKRREKEEQAKAEQKAQRKLEMDENSDVTQRSKIFHIDQKKLEHQQQGLYHMHSFLLDKPPRVAIDCRFLTLHSHRGMNLAAIQLKYLISENITRKTPWPLFLVNFDETNADLEKTRKKHLAIIDAPTRPPITLPEVTSKNYTDLFPREELIYLSPDAEKELEAIESDKVYIIGGIVDRIHEPRIPKFASFETADSDGVEARKLPLDTYIDWKSGSKYLTLTAVLQILQDVYETQGNWKFALERHVPVRKTRSDEERNPKVRQIYKNYHNYEKEVIRIVYEKLGEDRNF